MPLLLLIIFPHFLIPIAKVVPTEKGRYKALGGTAKSGLIALPIGGWDQLESKMQETPVITEGNV